MLRASGPKHNTLTSWNLRRAAASGPDSFPASLERQFALSPASARRDWDGSRLFNCGLDDAVSV